jgi:hypothetical protein
MPDKDKHKIFSKEELFRLIDEKKSLPTDADDFDKEAMEGLSMLTDRKKVEGLNNSIDEALRFEEAKAKKKKNIYIFSAAASLLLVIGLFFLLKDISFDKKESVLAENTAVANENQKADEVKVTDEKIPAEKKSEEKSEPAAVTVATGESTTKTQDGERNETTVLQSTEKISGVNPPAPPVEEAITKTTPNRKTTDEESENARNDGAGGGKDYKASLAKDDAPKREEAKKIDSKLEDKEKDKTRYVTNTVWTTTPSGGAGVALDETKNKSAGDDYRSKNQSDADANAVAANNNIPAVQKSAELGWSEKSNGPAKKASKEVAKPDTLVSDMLAGYSYYDQKPGKGLVQGGAPQSAPAPVQTQTGSSAAFGKSTDIPNEQKVAQQEISGKKADKHESHPDNANGDMQQNAEPKTAVRGNADVSELEFAAEKESLQQYVKKNLKISAPDKSGKIVAEFEVQTDGKVDPNSVKITTKIQNCNPCSDDVKELVKTMPKLKSTNEKGKAVSRKQKLSVDYNAK